jgi:SnoaL-like domain
METMANALDDFDPIGVVVDWIDSCKRRHLNTLLDLYADEATVECCEGGSFRGRSEMERYWRPRLVRQAVDAFEIDALFPEKDGVSLDYRGYDGQPVRTHFRFDDAGKIRLTVCALIKEAA